MPQTQRGGVYICMKTIKLTKLQLEILKSSLIMYRENLSSISDDLYKDYQKRYGKNLSHNIDNIRKKLN